MLHLDKYGSGLLFIAKWFDNSSIIEQFLKYRIYNPLINLRIDLVESLPAFLRAFFCNNINIKIVADLLFNDFRSDSIVFLLFYNLRGDSRLSSKATYYILDFFFFEYDF